MKLFFTKWRRAMVPSFMLVLTAGSPALAQGTELFISEYNEGAHMNGVTCPGQTTPSSGGEKAIEIYNPTTSTVSLAAYSLRRYGNGSVTITDEEKLVRTIGVNTLAPGATFVIAGADATLSDIVAAANQRASPRGPVTTPTVIVNGGPIQYNGDDAMALVRWSSGTAGTGTPIIVDVFGIIGHQPSPLGMGVQGMWVGTDRNGGDTRSANQSLVRSPAISGGGAALVWNINTNPGLDPATFNIGAEWETYSNAFTPDACSQSYARLGAHTYTGARGAYVPTASVPTLTSFAPTTGPVGTTVTLTGTSFTGATAVKFNGTSATSYTVVSATSITATVPAGATSGTISVTTAGGTATSATSFAVVARPTATLNAISAVCAGSPATLTGTLTGAAPWSITYTRNGASPTTVSGIMSSPYSIQTAALTATTTLAITGIADANTSATAFPASVSAVVSALPTFTTTPANVLCNGAATGSITVTVAGGTSPYSFSKNNGVTYSAATVSPYTFAGLSAGTYVIVVRSASNCYSVNQSVAITQPVALTFTTAATGTCTGTSNGSITVTAAGGTGTKTYSKNNGATYQASNIFPGLTAGTYQIAVRDANGCTPAAQAVAVTSVACGPTLTSFTPASGLAGTVVTLTGTNFTGATAVKFNTVAATYTVVSATSITATVPATATTGTITVTTAGGTATSATSFTVVALPVVTLAVDSVTALPGTQVVVPVRVRGYSGMLGLQGTLQLDPTQLRLVSVEQISATLPGLAAANFNITGATTTGRVSFAYLSATNTAATLADGAVVFALRFAVSGSTVAGAKLPISWATGPVPVEVMKADFTAATVSPRAGSVKVPVAAPLSGTVRTGTGTAIPGATLALTGPGANPAQLTPTAGTFSFVGAISTGAYTLAPTKANDVNLTNGVTIIDLGLMQRHILGTTLLGAAHRAVAADVNNDAAITVADVAAVQNFILGNTTSFTGGALWRFYSSAQTFANQNAPWPLTQTRTYASAATATAQDFVGAKLGDVNNSWNPAIARPAPPAPGAPAAELQVLAAAPPGQTVRAVLLLVGHGTDAHAVQTTLAWDPTALRLRTVPTLTTGAVLGQTDQTAGRLPLLWTDADQSPLGGGGVVLAEVEFDILPAAPATTELAFTSDRVPTLAADNAFAALPLIRTPATIQLRGGVTGVAPAATVKPTLTLAPNPAHEAVQLSAAPLAPVRVFDALGRTVRTTTATAEGTATLDVRGLPAGVYVVRAGSAARRLVVE